MNPGGTSYISGALVTVACSARQCWNPKEFQPRSDSESSDRVCVRGTELLTRPSLQPEPSSETFQKDRQGRTIFKSKTTSALSQVFGLLSVLLHKQGGAGWRQNGRRREASLRHVLSPRNR